MEMAEEIEKEREDLEKENITKNTDRVERQNQMFSFSGHGV